METQDRFDILLVDDDPTVIRVFSRVLSECAPLRFAMSGKDALRVTEQKPPDLILLDVEMPDLSGFEVCRALKKNLSLQNIPIIFMSAHHSAALEARGLELGVSDFISKPPQPGQLLARVRHYRQLKLLSDTLRGACPLDFLTGTASHRHFKRITRTEWSSCQQRGAPLSLILAKIDAFSNYNEQHGEDAGDRCLQAIADMLRALVHRPADVLGRYSGSSFGLLLPHTPAAGACQLARRAVLGASQLHIRSVGFIAQPISLSVGVSCNYNPGSLAAPGDDDDQVSVSAEVNADDMVDAAEQALRLARKSATDRLTFQAIGQSAVRVVGAR